jgi:hypothetical protein
MSFAAINEVTRGFRMLLHSQLVRVLPSAVVTLLPPGDKLPDSAGVNLYLYRITESPFTRNQPWPGDRITPKSNRPALGLQLYYLLTPLASKLEDASTSPSEGDDAHTMLGVAMSTLQENPVLNQTHLPALPASGTLSATPGFDADTVLPDFLLNSFEQIKITLVPTNLEELSKIWATINQPYRLSVAYEVSLVEIAPTLPPPVNGGIVTSIGLTVFALSPPSLTSLEPAVGALAHIDAGGFTRANTLVIHGSGFAMLGQVPSVTVGGQPAPVQTSPPPSATTLTVSLPTALDAGPQADVSVTLSGRTSAPLPFFVTPWLASIVPVRTTLPAGQKVTLKGSGFTATPLGLRFEGAGAPTGVTPFDAGGTDTSASVTLPATLPNGVYQVRVVLGDVAGSASNSRTLEVIPQLDSAVLTIPSPPTAHTLTAAGARLNGNDIRLQVDNAIYHSPPNANATQLVYTFGRLLTPGSHTLSVSIDGHTSHSIDVEA